MQIYRELNGISKKNKSTSVALGAFDGLHLGHQKVISQVLDGNFEPSVFTFSEDPSKVLSGKTEYLMTEEDKILELEKMGIENIFDISFSSVRDLTPEEFFFDVLLGGCGVGMISCGDDFRFGKKAAGDVTLLKKLCEENGIILKICPPVMLGDAVIHSSAIRLALKNGDAVTAEKMLGRPFGFTLEVIHGNSLGRTIGIPTINQKLPEGFVLPKFGVYAAIVHIDGKKYHGTCNIGVKPTVGSSVPLAETWIADFTGDLYARKLRLDVLDFIRPEKKFSSLGELKAEIERNSVEAERICSEYLNKNK